MSASTLRVDIDASALQTSPRYAALFIGALVVWTSAWDGARRVGTVARFDLGFPIIAFDDGRWARGDAHLDLLARPRPAVPRRPAVH